MESPLFTGMTDTATFGVDLSAAVDPQDDGSDDATIKRLAKLSPLEYDRQRKTESDRLGVRPATLDKLVTAERKGNGTTGMEIVGAGRPCPAFKQHCRVH